MQRLDKAGGRSDHNRGKNRKESELTMESTAQLSRFAVDSDSGRPIKEAAGFQAGSLYI